MRDLDEDLRIMLDKLKAEAVRFTGKPDLFVESKTGIQTAYRTQGYA